MAAQDQASIDFCEILGNTRRKYDIIQTRWADDKNFEIKFRTEIPKNSDDFNALCDEWVDIFSEVTNTVWVKKISNTGPKIKFRKQYQCWTQGGKTVQKELLFDARRCRATLDMKVLTDNPLRRKKNKHIKMGLNVVVKMNFTHLHSTNPTARFAFFVHQCDPQPEAPKPPQQPNDRLPNLVANMVQKGLALSSAAKSTHQQLIPIPPATLPNDSIDTFASATAEQIMQQQQTLVNPPNQFEVCSDQIEVGGLEHTINLNHFVPLQNMNSVKLEVPQFQQVTQVLVGEADMGEPILFCQPTIMLDPSQIIPVTGHHSFQSHFVQLHPSNLNNQQQQGYL